MMALGQIGRTNYENENDTEDYNSLEDEEYEQKNSREEEDADEEFSETSPSTDYDPLEQERI